MNKLIKKVFITAKIELITGLHIGDSKDNVQIGGVDNPVVRRKIDNVPYIPGSSIKGKIRSLIEVMKGINADSKFKQTNCEVSKLFGSSDINDKNNKIDGNASRLIVRDAYLTEDSEKELLKLETTDMPYTEVKWENTIDRIKGKAENPRQQERVPSGAIFQAEFIINVFEEDRNDEEKLIDLLTVTGFKALEDDYLGGSGSRGYGQIKFHFDWEKDIIKKSVDEYFK